jgi:hemerythrin-like domain-containing protein
VGDRPHEAILTAAATHGCDLVFMASHGRRGIKGLLSGSVLQRVLQHTTLPVLVARIASNSPASDEQAAVATILDEHRSLAAVIHGLQAVVQAAVPDFRLMRAMLYYIENFPEKLHHPKEEAYLFRLLRQRDKTSQALIGQLQVQHAEGAAAFVVLRQALAAWEAGSGGGTGAAFAQALDRFAHGQWQHMRSEEALLLPAAHGHLSSQDWAEIGAAFSGNGDPRFTDEDEASFDKLFAQLLNLAAGQA